ncbi:MAG TPA: hypothetical protein VGZ23_11755 [bacterium]|nr:hypothetical protein [bacterium]
MARIDYFAAGIDSFELSLEHLRRETDRDLRAAILLGFHGFVCLLKAAAVRHDVSVREGSDSVKVPKLVNALKMKGWLSKQDGKALFVLNRVRNALEHEEAEYDRVEFQAAIHGVLPIIERVVREHAGIDLQDELDRASWDILMGIETFFEHRRDVLDNAVERVLSEEVGGGKDRLIANAQAARCIECDAEGLPWQGTEHEEVRCRLCGEVNTVVTCEWCGGPVSITSDEEPPYHHDECLQIRFERF